MFSNADLDRIVTGEIDLAFRRWTRQMHRTGGSQRTKVGVVGSGAIDVVDPAQISEADAARTGRDLASLLVFLSRKDGEVHRIELFFAGADERVALRQDGDLSETAQRAVREKLAAMDRRSRGGAWTRQHLELIEQNPGVLAETLAVSIGREKRPFKSDVRRLKELGLTESLPTGYRLSPRGQTILSGLQALAKPDDWIGQGLD